MKQYNFTVGFKTIFGDNSEFLIHPDEVLEPLAKEGLVTLLQERLNEMNEGATHTWILFENDPIPEGALKAVTA